MSWIKKHEKRIFAATGIDGVLEFIFSKISPINKTSVEFGVHPRFGDNTTNLVVNHNWKGYFIDYHPERFIELESFLKSKSIDALSRSVLFRKFLTAENINEAFHECGIPSRFDVLSIDVDGNDFWIWKALKGFEPQVIIMEYNARIPPKLSYVIRYNPKFHFDRGNLYFGASLDALVKLAHLKGYFLAGCLSSGTDAIFLNNNTTAFPEVSSQFAHVKFRNRPYITREEIVKLGFLRV